jgi:hypothetical protein
VLGQLGAAVPLTFMDYKTALSKGKYSLLVLIFRLPTNCIFQLFCNF